MGVGSQADLANLAQQLPKGRIAGEGSAEDEGVDKKADEPLDLGPGAVGDGRSDDDVDLPGVATEQGLESGR